MHFILAVFFSRGRICTFQTVVFVVACVVLGTCCLSNHYFESLCITKNFKSSSHGETIKAIIVQKMKP